MARKPHDTLADQQKAARLRREDGRRLLAAEKRHWRGGMYLLGYAIECRLKSYIMVALGVDTLVAAEQALRDQNGVSVSLTSHHDLDLYCTWADILGLDTGSDPAVFSARQKVVRWRYYWRYDPAAPKMEEAEAFKDAALLFDGHIRDRT